MINLVSIENYAFCCALLIFTLYFLFVQGRKKQPKTSGEKPSINSIQIFKKAGNGLEKAVLDKILKGDD